MFHFPEVTSLLSSSATELDVECGIVGYELHEKHDDERAERWQIEKQAKTACLPLHFTSAFVDIV